ncbi:zinc-binding dehydrogenase [Sandarakinorhabdus sp.]|uniref:zinc-binding dehydrogenase n=1 Tax=Sandarakinorhabdus sp. TaxID=1916663 RepID=UPI00286DBC04|nr:zinc-binding dehydrogenase [Sandarakinorhabdus sp.]
MSETMLQFRSLITAESGLEMSLAEVPVPVAGDGEILVRIEAAPINPSDIGLLCGAADMTGAVFGGTASHPVVTAPVPPAGLRAMAGRMGQSMPCGNEGAGTVVAAGAGAEALLGRKVAIIGGATYAGYRAVRASDALLLPEGATAEQGASSFVNPLTALGFVETMRLDGHSAIIHTAAASNLGQMLVRICAADKVPLVNIVRSAQQAALLHGLGATHVIDMTAPDFVAQLADACEKTGATLAFDAIGGGTQAGQILTAMEIAIGRRPGGYSRYGSEVHKQLYVYGGLDMAPTVMTRGFGMAWGMGGWLLFPFLKRLGAEGAERLKARVAAELTTTFASHYSARVSLAEMLSEDAVKGWYRRATGTKYLVVPD